MKERYIYVCMYMYVCLEIWNIIIFCIFFNLNQAYMYVVVVVVNVIVLLVNKYMDYYVYLKRSA